MKDVTSLLSQNMCKDRGLPYLNLTNYSKNGLAWIEMRTYLYGKGLILFSRQEIFVVALLFVDFVVTVYLVFRYVFFLYFFYKRFFFFETKSAGHTLLNTNTQRKNKQKQNKNE